MTVISASIVCRIHPVQHCSACLCIIRRDQKVAVSFSGHDVVADLEGLARVDVNQRVFKRWPAYERIERVKHLRLILFWNNVAFNLAVIVCVVRFLSWIAGRLYENYIADKDKKTNENMTGMDYSVDMNDSETVDITHDEIDEKMKEEEDE